MPVAVLLVNKSLLLLMLQLAAVLLTVSLVVSGGCILLLPDAAGWADIGQLCSVYGACTA